MHFEVGDLNFKFLHWMILAVQYKHCFSDVNCRELKACRGGYEIFNEYSTSKL